jgi:purine-binding chemotaxis protein CheW
MLEELRKQLKSRLGDEYTPETAGIREGLQFLAFRSGMQDMLVGIECVFEIIMPPPITFLPKAQSEVEGVIALRGEILPLVNLRRLLGMPDGQHIPSARVLVVRHDDDVFGIIVDEIKEFVWVGDFEVHILKQNYLSEEFKVVSKVVKTAGTVRPILDVPTVLKCVFLKGESNEKALA